MKKAICFVLILALSLSAVSVSVFAKSTKLDLCFALASDLHYSIPEESFEKTNDDPIFWYANRRAAMDNESGCIIDAFLEQCAENDKCEFVLISGDLVDSGRSIPEEHTAVAAKFRSFEATTGKQVYVIDGNHDLGNDSKTEIADFKRIYAEFGYDKALVTDEDSCSYTADLGEGYRLIALDSCNHNKSTEDGLTVKRLQWAKAQAEQAKKDGRHPILMMHHNLLNHIPVQSVLSSAFIVKNHLTVAEMFANWGIKLVFTGHEHCSDAAKFTSSLGNVIYDFATTALTMYPLQYRLFTLTEDETKYEAKTIDSIDTEKLVSEFDGYSDEQIALMNEGLNNYALGFFKAGIRHRLLRSLSPEKLKIDSDDIYYDLVMTAVNKLTGILEMPLYGENSLSALAQARGITLPKTEFTNAWDLVTTLASVHYAGEENYPLDSTEVTLLLKAVAVLLHEELSAFTDGFFINAGKEILRSLGVPALPEGNPVTPCEYFLLALVSPLLYEFAVDSDGVNDNNGSLPGYGEAPSDRVNTENIIDNLNGKLNKLLKYLSIIITYLLKIF